MSLSTKFLKLFKWDLDNTEDLESDFNIEKSLNDNWDKIDEKIEKLEEVDKTKVDKKEGYGLSQEDFTTILMQKLENLKNYDDSVLRQILDGSIKDVILDPSNGHIIFYKNDGTTCFIDTALELIIENGIYDKKTKKIVLTLANENVIEIPIGDLITDIYSKSEIHEILSNYEIIENEVFETQKIVTESNSLTLSDTEEGLNLSVNEIESNKLEQVTSSVSNGDEYDSPSPSNRSEVEGVTGDVILTVKNSDNSNSQNITISLGNKSLY